MVILYSTFTRKQTHHIESVFDFGRTRCIWFRVTLILTVTQHLVFGHWRQNTCEGFSVFWLIVYKILPIWVRLVMIYFAIYSIFAIFMNCTTLDTEYNEIQRHLKGFVVSQKAIAQYDDCVYRETSQPDGFFTSQGCSSQVILPLTRIIQSMRTYTKI